MKHIFLLGLLAVLISCNNEGKSEEPIEACPLSLELDQLEVKFLLQGTLPSISKLHLSALEVQDCNFGAQDEFCITSSEFAPDSIIYKVRAHHEVLSTLQIELYDDHVLRLARTNETLTRARTRPEDPCGSGYISKITIQE